jgi:nicotinamidase/pyrazinamidase
MRIASFDVDAQRGFTPLCPGELPVAEGDQIVNALNAQAKLAEFRVGSKDAHPQDAVWTSMPPFTPVSSYENVDLCWPRHCVVGTEGNKLLPGLPSVTEYDFFVFKGCEPYLHPYGACYHDLPEKLSTGVVEYLEAVGVDTVIVGGLATDYCVKTTALQLKRGGFKVIVNLEACRGVAKESTEKSIQEMIASGITVVAKTTDIGALLK